MIQVFLRICGDYIFALCVLHRPFGTQFRIVTFCILGRYLGAIRNWRSLIASLKRSHAIPGGLRLLWLYGVMGYLGHYSIVFNCKYFLSCKHTLIFLTQEQQYNMQFYRSLYTASHPQAQLYGREYFTIKRPAIQKNSRSTTNTLSLKLHLRVNNSDL